MKSARPSLGMGVGVLGLVATASVAAGDLFPQVMAFRPSDGEVIKADSTGAYSEGPVSFDDFAGFSVVHDRRASFLLEVEAEYGEAVTTIWHRSWGSIGKQQLVADRSTLNDGSGFEVYSAHWLFEEPGRLTEPVRSGDESLRVDAPAAFEDGDDVMVHYYDPAAAIHHWDRVEHLEVAQVAGDQLHLQSATTLSWDLEGELEVWIAPHARIWPDIAGSWAVNLSRASPSDGLGRVGWEMLVDYWVHIWDRDVGGEIDGLELDGARWRPDRGGTRGFPVDSDNDGEADYGYLGGIQEYGLGGVECVAALRSRLDHRIVQCDSSVPSWGYRDFEHVSGIEMENFPEAVGRFEQFSTAFTHLTQFVTHLPGGMSYGFTKEMTALFGCGDPTLYGINNDFRIGLVSDLLVGMPHPYAAENSREPSLFPGDDKCFNLYHWDEYYGGDLGRWGWLGRPQSKALRDLGNLGPNLIPADATWDIKVDGCVVTNAEPGSDPYLLQVDSVCPLPEVDDAFIRAYGFSIYTDSTATENAYAVFFGAEAFNSYGGNSEYDWFRTVPRLVQVELVAEDLETGKSWGFVNEVLMDATGSIETFGLQFLIPPRHRIWKLNFRSGEETGALAIHGPELRAGGAERWLRYFAGGAAILNVTPQPWWVRLEESRFGWRRISGQQDPEVHDGSPGLGEGANVFRVPPFDGLLVHRAGLRGLPRPALSAPR